MNLKGKIPILIVAALAWIVIISSCANQGMPQGGPRDSVPPVLIETKPEFRALNFDDDKIQFTFDEYIDPLGISDELVISPPLTKRPIVRTKSKTLIIQFNEDLQDSITYSVDFKNSIVDNNEQNPYENFRFSFSTWDVYDSLRIAGRVMNAFNLETVEKNLVVIHENLHDSAIYKARPKYIAKTNEEGMFMVDNIAPGKYHVFAINDANNDLMYNEGAEEIAYYDSIIIPSAHFHEELDTLVKGVDSMLVLGHTHFYPEPLYLRQFTEDIFEQYFETYKRDSRYRCTFVFNESVEDTFKLNVVDHDFEDWYIVENNTDYDSLIVWISDTTVAKIDSMVMEVSYYQLDSLSELYVQKDTIDMFFKDPPVVETKPKKRKKKDGEEEEEEDLPPPVPQFTWKGSVSSTFDLNKSIGITAPDPVQFFDSTSILLHLTDDTLKTPIPFTFEKDTAVWRKYNISANWQEDTGYTLLVDSAACTNIYGITSKRYSQKFTTRERDYYGKIILNLSNIEMNMIVQILKNDDNEAVLYEKEINEDGFVEFDYLHPEKYKVKVIYDENGNGEWDSGSFQDKLQAEKVAYYNEIAKVRSNWDAEIIWDLTVDLTYHKNIRDRELEEKLRKEAEKKAEEERNRRENPQQGQNNMFGGSGQGLIRQ